MKIGAPTLLVVCLFLAAGASGATTNPDPKQEAFRRDMLPKVGQRIAFVGMVTPGKFGPYVTPDNWVGVYVKTTTTNRADLLKLNGIDRQRGRTIKIEGVLHRAEERSGTKLHGVEVSGIPEHFYFDVAEVSFSELKIQREEKTTTK
jgi:hypothetical protein